MRMVGPPLAIFMVPSKLTAETKPWLASTKNSAMDIWAAMGEPVLPTMLPTIWGGRCQ